MRWRTDCVQQAALANSTKDEQEWQEQLESWARTLSNVTHAEGLAAIDRMERGQLSVPAYGDIALTILRDAKSGREHAKTTYADPPSYLCTRCRDTGIVEVWNPHFVEDYRNEFADIERHKIDRDKIKGGFNPDRWDPARAIDAYTYRPANWLSIARRWWNRKNDAGGNGLYHVALCDCDCPRRRVLSSQLEEWKAGTRRIQGGKMLGPPACGPTEYMPDRQPLKTARPYDDLKRWYASNDCNAAYEWHPGGAVNESN